MGTKRRGEKYRKKKLKESNPTRIQKWTRFHKNLISIHHSVSIPAKNAKPESNHEEPSDKPQMNKILLLLLFNVIKDRKTEEIFCIKGD